MAEERVEMVRRATEAFNRSGFGGIREFCSPDLVFHEPPEQPAPRVLQGWDAALEAFTTFDEAWASHTTAVEEIRDIDDERVLVLTVETLRGRDGIVLEQPAGQIFTFRDGLVCEYHSFWSRDTALEAAGARGAD
jgi:ketosteroid isomerase-like protein